MNVFKFSPLLLSLVFPLHAHAGETEWAIQALVLHQHVEEIGRTGNTLVEESGLEPGVELVVRWVARENALSGKMLLSSSTLDYEGRTQSGVPVDSATDYRRLRATLGYSRGITDTTKLNIQLETEWLSRDINGTGNISGLQEDTKSSRLLFGVEKHLGGVDRPIRVDLAAVVGVSGTQTISAPGIIDDVDLPEGRTLGARVAANLPLGESNGRGLAWSLAPTVEYLHSERSEDRPWFQNGVRRGTLAQPETRRWSAGVGLMASW
jgi:hypothetical protein